jgi:muramidase (phage lysozyme)
MPVITPKQAGGANRCAFLDALAFSEIGPALLAKTDNGYNVLVGSTPDDPMTFSSYARHPDLYNAHLGSTAAGRYQILARWWAVYQKLLNLPDFSPLSQDMYALQQIRERKAIALIDAGAFQAAVTACNGIWASLPGSPYGQRTNPMSALQDAYVAAGGTLSPT